MSHYNLGLLVKAHLHSYKMRKRRNRRILPGRPNRANELWYKAQLLGLVRLLRSRTESAVIPMLQPETFRGDAIPGTVASRIASIARSFGNIDVTAQRLSRIAVERNLQATDAQLIKHIRKAVNINIQSTLTNDGIREALRDATTANIDLITSIPSQYFEKLTEVLDKNWIEGSRWEDLADAIKHVGDVTESRAKLIARDQTSKMNGAFNEARQTSIGIERYEWQTAGDERVRDSHAANDGKVFSWDDPPEETGNPGEDINCRCVAIPIFDLDDDVEGMDSFGDASLDGNWVTINGVHVFIKGGVITHGPKALVGARHEDVKAHLASGKSLKSFKSTKDTPAPAKFQSNGGEWAAKDQADKFSHGYCLNYAAEINKETGMEVMSMVDANGGFVHAFAAVPNQENRFLDVKGISSKEQIESRFGEEHTVIKPTPEHILNLAKEYKLGYRFSEETEQSKISDARKLGLEARSIVRVEIKKLNDKGAGL